MLIIIFVCYVYIFTKTSFKMAFTWNVSYKIIEKFGYGGNYKKQNSLEDDSSISHI